MKCFSSQLRDDEIVSAIQSAEKKTSGEIRVFIHHKSVESPVAAAQIQFEKLGMTRTKLRNGVLIFVAPHSRNFAVIGDTAIHQRCGESFWTALADEMTKHFKKSEFTDGITHAISKAGELLAVHFPRQPEDINELPDRVENG